MVAKRITLGEVNKGTIIRCLYLPFVDGCGKYTEKASGIARKRLGILVNNEFNALFG